MSILDGTGAGRDGGSKEELCVSDVGDGDRDCRVAARLGLFGVLDDGLSSRGGVAIGEVVSWLDVSPVRPGGWVGSGTGTFSCGASSRSAACASEENICTGDSDSRPVDSVTGCEDFFCSSFGSANGSS